MNPCQTPNGTKFLCPNINRINELEEALIKANYLLDRAERYVTLNNWDEEREKINIILYKEF